MLKAQHAQGGTQTQSAANSRALEEAGLSAVDVQDLIGTLEDPDARDRLLNQLKTLKAGADAAALPSEYQPSRFGGRIVESLSDRINRISEELVGGATMVLNAPRLVDWVQRQMSVPENQALGRGSLESSGGSRRRTGYGVGSAVVAGPDAKIGGRAGTRFCLDAGAVPVGSHVARYRPDRRVRGRSICGPTLLHPDEITRLLAISLVNANVIARAIMAAARMFFVPRATNIRVLQIGDEARITSSCGSGD